MNLSVIIPSRNVRNLEACVAAVRRHEPAVRVIVIDDGLDLVGLFRKHDGAWGTENSPVRIIPGDEPFVFARNCNIGIHAAGTDDVILLNDDALLETPAGFQEMQKAADENSEYGVIGAVTNVTGQDLQWPQDIGLREVPDIAFVCVLIPRRTISRVGFLDERYRLDYGVEDLDYCRACHEKQLRVGVFDFCYVDHGALTSTFRGDPHASRSFALNKALYDQKWSSNVR